LAEFKRNKAEAIARQGEQVKVAKAAKAAKKALLDEETEGDKGKKRARLELESEGKDEDEGRGAIIGNMVEKDGVTWTAEDGRICYSCGKAHWRCLWREDGKKRAKVCFH
jgi:hypothetical protein